MTDTKKHTPTPWKVTGQGPVTDFYSGADGRRVFEIRIRFGEDFHDDPVAVADAALIVEAVNSHEALKKLAIDRLDAIGLRTEQRDTAEKERDVLKAQNAELAAALKEALIALKAAHAHRRVGCICERLERLVSP